MIMIRSTIRSIVPRNVRFVSTTVNTSRTISPSSTSSSVTTSSTGAQANITTTASSIANPGPAAGSYVTGMDGRLKSAHRSYHANSSESISGLNDFTQERTDRLQAKLLKMNDAKELAGMNH